MAARSRENLNDVTRERDVVRAIITGCIIMIYFFCEGLHVIDVNFGSPSPISSANTFLANVACQDTALTPF